MKKILATLTLCALCAPLAHGLLYTGLIPLTVEEEVPAPTIGDSDPAGLADITYDDETNLLSWEVTYADLTSPTTMAHFHGPAEVGATAGVEVTISPENFPSGATDAVIISDDQETDLLAGLWYVNLHTENNAPGELRGQVELTAIPEPSALALLGLAGLALVGMRRRR